MRFASLGSGSKGNSIIVDTGTTSFLVDCGFSKRELEKRLFKLNFEPERLDAILVTHEHSDHISGVSSLAHEFGLTVFATHGTILAGDLTSINKLYKFNAGEDFVLGDVFIQSVAVPHDAREPCQYRLSSKGSTLGILTDLGMITGHVEKEFFSCDCLVLEFNHDLTMLRQGPYPDRLKKRISGQLGHLSNLQAATFLEKIHREKFHLVVAHMSSKNNSKNLILESLGNIAAKRSFDIVFAQQDTVAEWKTV